MRDVLLDGCRDGKVEWRREGSGWGIECGDIFAPGGLQFRKHSRSQIEIDNAGCVITALLASLRLFHGMRGAAEQKQ